MCTARFRSGPLSDFHGSLQLLNSSHVRERDKALLRSIMVGGVWNGFLLERLGGILLLVGSVGLLMVMVICFGECTFPPLVEIRENPEFHDLMREDKGNWPRCLLWHGWVPMLSGVIGVSTWSASASESASYLVEAALGSYSTKLISECGLPDDFGPSEVASLVPDHPNVWTDGSLVLDQVTGVSASGAGFFAHSPEPLQSVQRAEMSGVILALQSSSAVHLELTTWVLFVMFVGRLLGGCPGSIPFELVNDGDLLLLIDRCFIFVVGRRFGLLRLRVMLMRVWFLTVGWGG